MSLRAGEQDVVNISLQRGFYPGVGRHQRRKLQSCGVSGFGMFAELEGAGHGLETGGGGDWNMEVLGGKILWGLKSYPAIWDIFNVKQWETV